MASRGIQVCHGLFKSRCLPPQTRYITVDTASRKYTPRRALVYVPGNDKRKLMKIPSLNADCVVMDCEDGVALNRKEEARHTSVKMLTDLPFGRTEACIRVNSVSSGLAEEDLKVVLSAQKLPTTLLLPKVDTPGELDWVADKLQGYLGGKKPLTESGKFNLIIYMESAVGLLNLRDICYHGLQLTQSGADFQLDGVVFGSDDFVADIGASRTKDSTEILYARQHTLVAAKAFSLQAIDLVHINFKDIEGLTAQSLEGARMGYTGKQVIHPLQVAPVQQAFTPSREKVDWATQLIAAFEEHQQSGKGAFTFRGSMIDMPLLRQAKNIVQLVSAVQPTL